MPSDNVVDFGKAKKDRDLSKFHKKFMGNVKDRVADKQSMIAAAVEQGVFAGFDIGDRFRTKKGGVFKIVGYNLSPIKNEQQKEMASKIYKKLGLGNVELIKIGYGFYRSMLVVEGVTDEGVTTTLYADMLRKQGVDKLDGPQRSNESSLFDALMDEDVIRDRKVQKAKDLLDKVPTLVDILLDPKASLTDLLLHKPKRPEGDGDIFEMPSQIKENFRPSTFIKVGRNLVELQMGWADKEKNKARSDVFVNGKTIGKYTFEGKNYRVDEDNIFESVEEAIAHLIKTNAPYALPQSNASDYLKTLANYSL